MFTVKEVWQKTGIPLSRLYYEIQRGYIKTQDRYGKAVISQKELDGIIEREERKRQLEPLEAYCTRKGIHRSQVPEENLEKINGLFYVKEGI